MFSKHATIAPASFFTIVALTIGSIYIFLIPPFQAPDEGNHWLRAYHVSEGYIFGVKTADQRFGGYLPESFATVSAIFLPLRYHYEERTSFGAIQTAAQIPLQPQKRVFLDFPNVAYYAPIPYAPQALVFALLRPFAIPPLFLLYIGRLITLLFWTFCVRYAIRQMPFHAWTMTWIALLPASLFLHASLTADALTNGLCFILIAIILKIAFSGASLSYKHLLFIIILSLFITINKVVYAPLILLLLFIPFNKYGTPARAFFILSSIFMINAAALIGWYKIAGQLFIPYDAYNPVYREGQQLNPGVHPHEQLAYILQHPLAFIKTLLLSYAESAMATMAHYIGKFGWEKNYLPTWLIGLLALALPLSALSERTPGIQLKIVHRILFVSIGIAMTLAFSMVIYMQWNPVGNDRIWSLGGRYFIPIFPLFLLALYPTKALPQLQWDKRFWMVLFGMAYLISVILVWERYYK